MPEEAWAWPPCPLCCEVVVATVEDGEAVEKAVLVLEACGMEGQRDQGAAATQMWTARCTVPSLPRQCLVQGTLGRCLTEALAVALLPGEVPPAAGCPAVPVPMPAAVPEPLVCWPVVWKPVLAPF